MSQDRINQRWDAACKGREQQLAVAAARFLDLQRLMADLRGPDGCPWDREQSLASLRQYVREEADEVCSAIDELLALEAEFRAANNMDPADPASPDEADRARTAKKGHTIVHHPHHQDFAPANSASGAPLPELNTSQQEMHTVLLTKLQDELGDLLLQTVFMGDILYAMGRGGVESSAAAIVNKLIRRHPHVYGDAVANDSAAVLANWERIKQLERDAEP